MGKEELTELEQGARWAMAGIQQGDELKPGIAARIRLGVLTLASALAGLFNSFRH